MLSRLTLILLLSALSACSVRFPQIDRLMEIIEEPENPIERILWQANIGGVSQDVIPITAEQGSVYANKQGASLVYDGFIVRTIETFSQQIRHIDIRDEQVGDTITREVWVDYRPVATWTCDIWRVETLLSSTQQCESLGVTRINRRQLNPQGELIDLQQYLGIDDLELQLKKKITNQ
ncbi:MAG: hypothetical protein RL336_804 [Pseudomonadota bacterium]|jgi:hypothetical protein